MIVPFKKLDERASIPSYAKPGDAGLDIKVISCEYEADGPKYIYGTGLSVEIPEGFVGLIFPRSSIHKYDLTLSNCVGVVDSGYRGEIKAVFRPTTPKGKVYDLGERALQMIIMPYPKIDPIEVRDLSSSERGMGGFGSTGV